MVQSLSIKIGMDVLKFALTNSKMHSPINLESNFEGSYEQIDIFTNFQHIFL